MGTVVGDEEITGWSEQGYVYQRRVIVDDPVPALEQPLRQQLGQLDVEISASWRTEADGSRTPTLIGHVPEQPVDLHELGLVPLEADAPDAEALVVVDELAPFGVQVDRRTGFTVPVDVVFPADRLSPGVGATVVLGADEVGTIVDIAADGRAVVRSSATRVDPAPLPNPNQRRLPLAVPAIVAAAGALAWGWSRRRR